MLTRRALLTGGVVTGTMARAGATAPGTLGSDAQGSRSSGDADERMVKVLEDIREQMRADSGVSLPVLDTIRGLQREFLKTRGKFPDFIDVGIEVWESLATWHVRTRQVLQVQRMGDGRYTMPLFQTNVVVRHDVANNYIGQPYDGK